MNNNLTEEIIQLALRLPIHDLNDLNQTIEKKNQSITNMKFEDAAHLREKEKKILEKLGIPTDARCAELLSIVRERKINTLLDGNF